MTDTQWGRKETIVRPPHYPVYSFGAVFVSLIVAGLCIYLHLAFVLTPLQTLLSLQLSRNGLPRHDPHEQRVPVRHGR